MNKSLKILSIEPFNDSSHNSFLKALDKYSHHNFTHLTQSAHHWKWKMNASGYSMAKRANLLDEKFDVILASDYLNLPSFLGFCDKKYLEIPNVLYFHENQLTYPIQKGQTRDFQYGFINLLSCISANEIWFNSKWHENDFFNGAKKLLKILPEKNIFDLNELKQKSKVMHLGIEESTSKRQLTRTKPLKIIWNHRWEYDKNPDLLVKVIEHLHQNKIDCEFIICGKSFKKIPECFQNLQSKFPNLVKHMGYFERSGDYHNALANSDLVISTANHEFFGVSVLEALDHGCIPLLPNRLSYPELLPQNLHKNYLYDSHEELMKKISHLALQPNDRIKNIENNFIESFYWKHRISEFDKNFNSIFT